MEKEAAIELAISFASQKGICFTGVDSAIFASDEDLGLTKLGRPGDHWFVYLSLAKVHPLINAGDTTALAVNCSSGEVFVVGIA